MGVLVSTRSEDSLSIPKRDVVFMFAFETWSEARERKMFRPQDRLLLTLADHPAVNGLVVSNAFRSWPIRTGRKLLGRLRETPLDLQRPNTGFVSPYRVRRR